MTQEVQKLQELLARVKRNAALPRTLVSAGALSPSAPVHEAPVVAFSPPPYAAPAAEFTAEEVFFESQPPPAPAPAPVYVREFTPPPVAPPSASLDASVDDLLLEDPFPSSPPGPSYNDVLEDPMPLVKVASPRAIGQEDDISGVMSISEFSDEQPEELLEDDIVEMTSVEAELPVANNALDELSFADVDDLHDKRTAPPSADEPPASSSRSKIAGTMDEALARAAEQIQLDEGREVPLKTPPPESGPQAAAALPVGIHAPMAPDIEELLEADIVPVAGVHAALPTAEQLGQTIDLEDARGPSLELDQPAAFAPDALEEDLSSEELEVTLPGRAFAGGYQEDLMPPPEARQDLDAHRQRVGQDPVPPPESAAHYPSQQPVEAPTSGFAAVSAPSSVTTDSYSESVSTVTIDAPAKAEFAPELLARPDVSPSPVAKFIRIEAPRPKTFMELLDSSLALGSD
ncbi:MAG TPA: hypothetical protein VJV79_35220 [Polyangiaceae bacterium]|nr:hypothetical protein [Polyangiaceae bacterium]